MESSSVSRPLFYSYSSSIVQDEYEALDEEQKLLLGDIYPELREKLIKSVDRARRKRRQQAADERYGSIWFPFLVSGQCVKSEIIGKSARILQKRSLRLRREFFADRNPRVVPASSSRRTKTSHQRHLVTRSRRGSATRSQ